ncbi:MAG: hypothetical protein ACOC04_04750 [Halothece sp.]
MANPDEEDIFITEDLQGLRVAKEVEKDSPSLSLDEVEQILGLTE